jgi:hypothetical protein
MRTKHFDEDKNQWHSRNPTQSKRTKTAEKDEGKIPTQSMSHPNKPPINADATIQTRARSLVLHYLAGGRARCRNLPPRGFSVA